MKGLHDRASEILKQTNQIKNAYLKKYDLKSDFLNIFCQTSDEYDFYSEEALKIGQLLKETQSGIYIELNEIFTAENEQIFVLKIRKPDTTRKQSGAMNYTSNDYDLIREENLFQKDNFKFSANTLNVEEIDVFSDGKSSYLAVVSVPVLQALKSFPKANNETDQIKQELDDEKNKRLQLFSDFQNYQKRVENEKAMYGAIANISLIQEMLEVADDINLALEDRDLDINHAKTSLKSAQDKLVSGVERAGVEKVEVKIGEDFDKERMEAVSMVPVQDEALKGKVIAVITSAYKYRDKEGILKAAKVVVGK